MRSDKRTPERLLLIGCKSFAGIDALAWEDQKVPNIPDYDTVIVSVPHITSDFLAEVRADFLEKMRNALLNFLHSEGRLVVLLSPKLTVTRPNHHPDRISNFDWSPVGFRTPAEEGQSVVIRANSYQSYLNKMTTWSFWVSIPQDCLTKETINFYGPTHDTSYSVPLQPYIENRYGRVLAGDCHIEIRKALRRSSYGPRSRPEYPEAPDFVSGRIVLLPLLDGLTPEDALLAILREEIGYSSRYAAPDWVESIPMPLVPGLRDEIASAKATIAEEETRISRLLSEVGDIESYRRLLYSSGSELEDTVRRSFELLGGVLTAGKYAQEEYILVVDGVEHLVEVKGVSKSISLTDLRQLTDYMLKYEEDTEKAAKGILLGNAWRNLPPAQRNAAKTPFFPDNVVKRAEQLGIGLVSSLALFEAVVKVINDKAVAPAVLRVIVAGKGVVTL